MYTNIIMYFVIYIVCWDHQYLSYFFVYKISYPYVAKREICSAFDIELAVFKMLLNCFNKDQYHFDRLDPNTSTIASLTYILNIQIQIRREHR